MRGVLWLWGPVAMYMAGIFFVSADSAPPSPSGVSDKLLHLLAYAGLAVTVCRAVTGGLRARITRWAAMLTLLVTIGYGISDEIHQMFVPGRSPDVYDVLADAAGAVIGLIVCVAWGIIRTPSSQLPTSNSAP